MYLMSRYETILKEVIKIARHNLFMFRCNMRLTQAEMAAKLGVSRATYSFIERGHRSGTADFWAKFKRVFNIPDSEMYSLMKLEERTEK